MDDPVAALPPDLDATTRERFQRAYEGSHRAADVARITRLLAASDFAADVWRHEPTLFADGLDAFVEASPGASEAACCTPWPADQEDDARRALRRFRRIESVRIIARSVLGRDDVAATLAASSALAARCLELALIQAERAMTPRFGTPRAAGTGEPLRLAVIAMGKLGGGELNFSSDVDLIFAFAASGTSDGPRELDNEDYFLRLGQRMIQLLADVTADGFAYRVDMRLRPFGTAGRLALSFAAMEQYYQHDGRDWERYAWIKARVVAGDRAGGERLIAQLAPFVYRRYLDYTAIDGLREMKALIDAEVDRRELADHLKLGPGGIREAEFFVQLLQLVRGGRERALRTPSFRAALHAARDGGHLDPAQADAIERAYDFLRQLENRVQMLRDEQTHELPGDALDRRRIAVSLGFDDTPALLHALARHRDVIATVFATLLRTDADATAGTVDGWRDAWLALAGDPEARLPPPYGAVASDALAAFASTSAFRALEGRTRARLDALLPRFLERYAGLDRPDEALTRTLALLGAVLGRPTYLALLDEQPVARERLADVMSRSAFLAERVAQHPLLLDDLLDTRNTQALPDDATMRRAVDEAWHATDPADVEERLSRLAEARQSAIFRLALASLTGRDEPDDLAWRLAAIASATVAAVLDLAVADTVRQWGALADDRSGLAILAYGSLGGEELGFTSDLDLVFVTDATLADAQSRGARSVEASRWFARVAQRVVHWLTTPLQGGALYAVDTRLRPDGSKGLLVTSLDAFAQYQRERAWVWEHQALVRARPVAGDPALMQAATEVRTEVLTRPRDGAMLQAKIGEMRERWRAQLDRTSGDRFDLKQGRGGLVDLEFALQLIVLRDAPREPVLVSTTRTPTLIGIARSRGLIDAETADALRRAHATLLGAALDATLDRAPRLVRVDAAVSAARATISAFVARLGIGAGA